MIASLLCRRSVLICLHLLSSIQPKFRVRKWRGNQMSTTIRHNIHFRTWLLNKYYRVQTGRCRACAVRVELFFDWNVQKSESRNGNQNVIRYCALKYAMRRGDLELWIGRGMQLFSAKQTSWSTLVRHLS